MTQDQLRVVIFDALGSILFFGGVASAIIGLIMMAIGASPSAWKR